MTLEISIQIFKIAMIFEQHPKCTSSKSCWHNKIRIATIDCRFKLEKRHRKTRLKSSIARDKNEKIKQNWEKRGKIDNIAQNW